MRTSTSVLIGCRKHAYMYIHTQPYQQDNRTATLGPVWPTACVGHVHWWLNNLFMLSYSEPVPQNCANFPNPPPPNSPISRHRHGDRFLLLRLLAFLVCLSRLSICFWGWQTATASRPLATLPIFAAFLQDNLLANCPRRFVSQLRAAGNFI